MFRSYKETRQALESGETTCQSLVRYYLSRIEAQASLNIYLEVYAQEALERAAQLDAQLAAKQPLGRLFGMVIGVKDVICHAGHGLQAGSRILDGFQSQFTATALERLLSEGAIVIGRQNCDEFAMGSTNESSAFGPTLNPVDPTRVPGGSSGASAAAVAANTCLASIGSDTGGSVRQPAAFCGVVGFKPTYSRISRYGLIAYASSFDTIGTLTHTVADAARLLEVMAGADDCDATVSHRAVPAYTQATAEGSRYRIGYIEETLNSAGLHPDVKEATWEKLEAWKAQGHEIVPVSFDLLDYVLPTYYILTAAEASTNLSRFDGVRYGYRAQGVETLEELYKRSRSEGFGKEVQRRIVLGTFVLSASYYDAYFTKAQRVRRLIKEKTQALLRQCDFLVSPTAPSVAVELGKFASSDVLEMYLADLFTVQASVAGIPAISIPNGTNAQGLPIGLQMMANAFEEEKLLGFAGSLTD